MDKRGWHNLAYSHLSDLFAHKQLKDKTNSFFIFKYLDIHVINYFY